LKRLMLEHSKSSLTADTIAEVFGNCILRLDPKIKTSEPEKNAERIKLIMKDFIKDQSSIFVVISCHSID
jgi:hypothetical protein